MPAFWIAIAKVEYANSAMSSSPAAASDRARLQRLLVPDQQPPAQDRDALHQHVANHGDLDDAGEYAGRIRKARGILHGGADAIAAHRHFGEHIDDQRDRQRDL